MKLIFLCLITGFFSANLSAQKTQSANSLKQENENLKATISKLKQDTAFLSQKIALCDIFSKQSQYELTSFSKSFKVEILSCKGDRDKQTVKIELLISHNLPHQNVSMRLGKEESKAIDELGNVFSVKEGGIGSSSTSTDGNTIVNSKVPTDIPVKCYIIVRNVLPSTDRFKFVSIKWGFTNFDDGGIPIWGNLEIRNFKIQW